MANRKLFNSKNITYLIENLLDKGQVDLVMQILQSKELKSLSPNILDLLKRRQIKIEDYNQTKVYSKTEIAQKVLEQIGSQTGIDIAGAKIIIDENMSAGVKIKSRDRLIDASLSTMLRKGLEELIENN